MPIPIQPAPALLVGLSARILLDFLNRGDEVTIKDHILLGVWQGVALHYAAKNSSFGILVVIAIAGKLFIEFNIYPDVNKCASTVIGVLLGFLGTDLITQLVDSTFSKPTASSSERRRRKVSFSMPGSREDKKRRRSSQVRASAQGGDENDRYPKYHPVSDITSVDSNSDLIRAKENMTPLEREVAALRARASLADSERRRYREERKWAISEGNMERAVQLKQQVKRYTALMQGFHREADTKMISGQFMVNQVLSPFNAHDSHRGAKCNSNEHEWECCRWTTSEHHTCPGTSATRTKKQPHQWPQQSPSIVITSMGS